MFKDRLQKIMKDKGLTLTQLARRSGISKSSVSLFLSGKRDLPKIKTAKKLAKALGVSAEYLLGFEQDNPTEIKKIPFLTFNPTVEEELVRLVKTLNVEELNTLYLYLGVYLKK